jgi:succinoglycan biosynthesis transport protein ExoP
MNVLDSQAVLLELRRFWWVLLVTVAAGIALGFWAILRHPLLYTSEARMLVEPRPSTTGNLSIAEAQNDPAFLGTQAAILAGDDVRDRVAKALPSAASNSSPVKLTAINLPQTSILLVRATGPNPQHTREWVQRTMTEFLALRREFRRQRIDKALANLNEDAASLDADRERAFAELNEFQQAHNIAALQDLLNADTAYLASLRKRLTDLRLQRSQVDAGTNLEAAAAGASIPLDSAESTTADSPQNATPESDPRVAAAKLTLGDLEAERERLLVNLRPAHPKVRTITARIVEMERTIAGLSTKAQEQGKDRVAQAERDKRDRLESMDREAGALNAEIAHRQSELADLSSQLSQYQTLKKRAESAQTASDKMAASLQAIDFGRNANQDIIGILENASSPRPQARRFGPAFLWGGLAGLVSGVFAVFVLSRAIQRFQTIAAVKKALPVPILGRIVADRWATHRRTVLDCDRNHLGFADSFRNLRSGLLHLPGEIRDKHCFSITSALPGEGKSVIAVNLSIALAATSARTLLIDGDIRRGKLHQFLGSEPGPGFSNLITGQSPLEEVVRPTRMPNLFLIRSGPRIPNIAEQLLAFGFSALLGELGQHFDFILVDTPPVLAADDAVTLAANTSWTMFVVRLGYSRPQHSQLAVDDLRARQIQVPGVVVNCVPRRLTGSHYYKYYSRQLEGKPFAALPAPPSGRL